MKEKDLKPPPVINNSSIIGYTRREKRELKKTQDKLLQLGNEYLLFKHKNTNTNLISKKFKEINHKWIEFALKWNNDFSNKLIIRITDFSNFIKDYEKNNKKKTGNQKI